MISVNIPQLYDAQDEFNRIKNLLIVKKEIMTGIVEVLNSATEMEEEIAVLKRSVDKLESIRETMQQMSTALEIISQQYAAGEIKIIDYSETISNTIPSAEMRFADLDQISEVLTKLKIK